MLATVAAHPLGGWNAFGPVAAAAPSTNAVATPALVTLRERAYQRMARSGVTRDRGLLAASAHSNSPAVGGAATWRRRRNDRLSALRRSNNFALDAGLGSARSCSHSCTV